MKKYAFLYLLLFISEFLGAQSSFTNGLLPKVVLSNQLSDHTKLINSIESRQLLWDDMLDNKFSYDYVLTDLTTIVSHKIGASQSINLGYLFRIEGDEIVHRSIQQFTIVKNLDALRLGHRFVTDQTFSNRKSPSFRLRYRVTLEKPLNGDRVDPNEFYLKFNNEYLGSYQSNKADLEIRIIPFIGYELNAKNKLELGLDYRLSEFFDSASQNRLWLSMNWYYSIR
ncbi:DUF2490 domain-containing protein [Aquimarina sp. MMG016]|uniref:DUF2490 domain-containing protein n=1 Tax=Aquimarina sp. MMG016 TaxID=2822690 RepID=UPI001B39DBDF|nr:DUF2490 domain-containing protein [Aquimarina sp. MMG016]MBQ4822735.1 DUF2490 domain-containing protein [Aquimarina sp. MMG016]